MVYKEGMRVPGAHVLAFCKEREAGVDPRVGFTVPRALGNAVARNRIRRRLREVVRTRLDRLDARWDVVFNPRKTVLKAPIEDLEKEVDRVFRRCKSS